MSSIDAGMLGRPERPAGHGTVPAESTRVSGWRFIAHFTDSVLYTVIVAVALIAAGVGLGALPDSTVTDVLFGVVLVVAVTVGQVVYYVLTQRRTGQSPGKRLAGIKVVDANGGVPTTKQLVKRTVPLLIEYFYVIALIGMLSSSHRQRFGDRWAGTYVVQA